MSHLRTNSPARRSAFSLLELLAGVTILGVITAVVMPRISVSGVTAKKQCCAGYRTDLNKSLERYFFANGNYPTSVDALANTEYYPEIVPVCPVSSEVYKIDPDTGRITHTDHN